MSRRFRDTRSKDDDGSDDDDDRTRGEPSSKRRRSEKAEKEVEAYDQTMEIPKEADIHFLRKMLSTATSTFVLQLHQQTRVRVNLGLSEGDGLRHPIVVLSGGADSTWSDCRSRIEELFHVSLERQQKFLKQFCPTAVPAAPPAPPKVILPRSEGDHLKVVPVAPDIVRHLMTDEHRQLLLASTGADPEWAPEQCRVMLRGSAEQVNLGQRALQRVSTHCLWGVSEKKITRLLKPDHVEMMLVRLSPMGLSLNPVEKLLSASNCSMSIGKDRTNDAVVVDPVVSRQHCLLELDFQRGAVYVLNLSTNGSFLNGRRLPDKNQGKVMLSHGDELLLKDPALDAEFGYVVNIVDHTVRVWEMSFEEGDIRNEMLRRREAIGCGN